jgi:aryl-alcohol dehydrogenase-like predicted oxidoreductase
MKLNKRQLGTSGLEITSVGFGSWAAGGGGWSFGWGPQDDEASIAAIRRAIAHGVHWIDTAAIYGLGHSEEIVHRALSDIPASERPFIFTKGGLIADRSRPFEPPQRNLRPESIRAEVEASLRRLAVERIDLYQFHWPDETGTRLEDSWGEMVHLVEEGKVRAAGVSNFNVAMLECCERIRHVDSLQPPFSLIHRQAAADLITWCAAHGTGVIVYSPMQSGLLTESFTAERVSRLAEDDWRRRDPEFQEPNLSRNIALRDALRPIAERYGTTVSVIAVAWTLSWPGITGAIVGARSAQQVDGWIQAGSIELTSDDLEVIGRAIRGTRAGSGPALPVLSQPAGGVTKRIA